MLRELHAFRVKITDAGHDTYAAWRESAHDDYVLALSIAAYTAETLTTYVGEIKPLEKEITDAIRNYRGWVA